MQAKINDFLSFIQVERGYSNNTVQAYRRDLNQFIRFAKGKEVDRNAIKEYLDHLYAKGFSAASAERKLASLKSLFHYLAGEGQVEEDPTADFKLPKKAKRLPKRLSM